MMSSEEVSILDSIAPVDSLGSLLDVHEIQNFSPTLLEEILFLSTILYFTPTHWTVWINEKTYTADDIEDDILKYSAASDRGLK